jgi:mono/diheme cytochrome c family protein
MQTCGKGEEMRLRYKKLILLLVGTSLGLGVLSSTWAFDAAQTFEKKCSSCHSIGGGVVIGPDLKDVSKRYKSEWIVKFVQSSGNVIESGDPVAVKLYNDFKQKDMPDQNFSEQEILDIIKFIDLGAQQTAGGAIKPSANATPEDVLKGEHIYLGLQSLTKGGPACVSCHSVSDYGALGGGTLAKDLTHAFSLYQDKGLTAALKNIAFPVMQGIYAGKELTDDENHQLRAFLYSADRNLEPARGMQKKFIFLGVVGVVLALGIIDFTWRRRRKKSVRKFRGGLR